MLKLAYDLGKINPYTMGGGSMVSHLLYEDDLLIFSDGDKRSVRNLLHVINTYVNILEQLVSSAKSMIFFSKHISLAKRDGLLNLSSFSESSWLATYLDMPVHVGRLTMNMLEPMFAKIQKKLARWEGKLSFGGKITLIRHVLHSMPILILSVMRVPNGTFKELQRMFYDFLWGSSHGCRKRKWFAWNNICLQVEGEEVWESETSWKCNHLFYEIFLEIIERD